jgi:ATP/maltotriose-dependent transcriptional regulator MalT/DNA-binding SARP family transcriptional activator
MARPRLFHRLDHHRRPVTWVWGPPGSGKTTLVASYLKVRRIQSLWYQLDEADGDPATFLYHLGRAARDAAPRQAPLPLLTLEYAAAAPTFAARFFRQLFGSLPPPFALVLDNYEAIPGPSPVHDILRVALEQVPDGGRAYVLSRDPPPPALARLRAGRRVEQLEWPDLRLTLAEARVLAGRLAAGRFSATAVRHARDLAGGWAAGLILLLERFGRARAAEHQPDSPPEVLFDYFAGEILNRQEEKTRSVLLRTAFLPRVSARMAESLTAEPGAGTILAELHRRHYFTMRWPGGEPVYEYHPLLRAFLKAEAHRRLSASQLREVLAASASLLHESGDSEGAATLWREAGDVEGLARLIETEGPQLVEQARFATLQAWLEGVPSAVVDERPWLLFCRGSAQMLVDFVAAQSDLARAFGLFRQRGDQVGMLHTWSAVTHSIAGAGWDLTALDPWLDMLGELAPYVDAAHPQLALRAAGAATAALTVRQPQHPSIREWVERTLTLVDHASNAYLRVAGRLQAALYHLHLGDLGTGRELAERALADARAHDCPTVLRAASLALPPRYALLRGAAGEALDYVGESVELSRMTGLDVHLGWSLPDAVAAMLQTGDLTSPGHLLEWLGRRSQVVSGLDAGTYHYLAGWHALLGLRLDQAMQHASQAVRLHHQVGMPIAEAVSRLLAIQVKRESGQAQEARRDLDWVLELAGRTGSDFIGFSAWLTQAQLDLDGGREATALEALRHAMAIGRTQGYLAIQGWRPQVLGQLCARALTAGIEVDYVRRLVTVGRLVPDRPPVEVEEWPWVIRLFTLGRFEVVREGQVLRFGPKAPQRPFDLLKVLIALGGREAPEARLTEALWPDADGDDATRALSVNIYRLRGLLGFDGVIRRHGGLVGLDPHLCWVDVWAVDRLLDQADAAERIAQQGRDGAVDWEPGILRAFDLHRGGFLANTVQAHEPWATSLGDRLRQRLLHHAYALGGLRRSTGDLEGAARWYERAREIHPAAELPARRLMEVYQQLGRRVDALAVYERLRHALAAAESLQPSTEMRALHAGLRA